MNRGDVHDVAATDHGVPLQYGRIESDADAAALLRILERAFGMKPRDSGRYQEVIGRENFRVVRDGATIAGGLAIIRMGQYFGGRRVSMAGIAAVGIAPWMRGRGAARTLMENTLRELRDDGFAISTLYPATQTLYRAVGYELAGSQYEITLPLDGIHVKEGDVTVRPIEARDEPAVEAMYESYAAQHAGHVARDKVMWTRVRFPRGKPTDGFLLEQHGQPVGYIYFLQKPARVKPYSLQVMDMVATTPAATRRLLAFLAEHRSVGQDAIWHGYPMSTILAALPEMTWKSKPRLHWMVRILDVKAALEQRGYPACANATLHFEIDDDLLPVNACRWMLQVQNGKASVTQGGDGTLKTSIRALASLYTGFMSACDLATLGWLRASDEQAIALASALFAGPAPWMGDGF